LLECHSYDIPRLVSEGAADLGIYHAKSMALGVISYRYCRDRIGLVVPIDHPLALRRELFMEEALEYDLIGYFPRHSLEHFLDYIGPSISRPPHIILQVANFETRCRMIREGLGIGLMPEKIAQGYMGPLGLSLLHLKDEWAERQSYLCVRDPGDLRSSTAELLMFLREQGKALENG
jgi:DNA-binding transcriptional LysR family regulator